VDHLDMVNVGAFHDHGINGRGVVIAVIDSGIDENILSFKDKVIGGYNPITGEEYEK
jgi:Subtilase family.